jgi:Arc/MetJ-type ribon-helix-helix transcriptional regulator
VTITLRPEHERLITEAMRTGAYQNPDDVIGRALEMLHSEDEWLLEQKGQVVTLQIIWRKTLHAIWRKPAPAVARRWQGGL